MPYRYEHSSSYTLDNKKYLVKENFIDGEKGLALTYIKKDGDKFYRITVKETTKDVFSIITKKNEDPETKEELNLTKFKKLLQTNKDLEFVKKYFENDRGKYKGLKINTADDDDDLFGGDKKLKKVSKKGTKKVSKKGTKKKSKKKI